MSQLATPQPEGYAGVPAVEPSEGFNLREYWRVIVRRRWLIVPFFLATVVVTGLVTIRQQRIYDATATLIIDVQAPKVLDTQQVGDVSENGPTGYWYSKEFYETQYKVITSRAVAQRVVDKLQLGNNLEFLGLDDEKDGAARERERARLDPVVLLQKQLKVEPVKDSRIVRIRVENPNRDLAALLANSIAEAYIAENLSVRTSNTQSASDWLEKQLADLEVKLEQTSKALYAFKREHDIVATSWEDRQTMVSQRLTAVNEALTKARVQKATLQARNEAIEAFGKALAAGSDDADGLTAIASNPVIQQLKMRYLEARSECADLKLRYLDSHPKLEACETKLELSRAGLQHQVKAALDAARQEYQEVSKTEQNLQKLLNETKTDAFALNQYEKDYMELKRSYDNNVRLYETLMKRLKDTGVTGLLQSSNVRILDRARPVQKPIRPDTKQNLILAALLGILGGVALAFGAEQLDTSITSQQQVEEKLGLTFLGIVPSIPKTADGTAQDLVVHRQPKSAVAECVRSVRTNLLFMSPDKPLKTILITSSGPQEGKTTVAAALAEAMADSGNKVLLVDADMRRPRIHRIFGIPNSSAGLSSLILGQGGLAEAIKSTEVSNLFVLPCGPIPPNPSELLHTEAFARLVDSIAAAYDRVIIDSPPVGVVADAVVASTRVDGTLMVLKAGRTSRDVAKQAVRQLKDVKARVFGAVLNDLDLEDQKYGQYYYYYRYGYYYGDSKTDAST